MRKEAGMADWQLALLLLGGLALFVTIIIGTYSLAVYFNVH